MLNVNTPFHTQAFLVYPVSTAAIMREKYMRLTAATTNNRSVLRYDAV